MRILWMFQNSSLTERRTVMFNMEMRDRNVVIYARVSTEHEAQINALENQLDWYKPILEMNKHWHVVDWYVD
ncbi:MAG TPA: hypothetical protein DIW36_06935, partial [Ruminococcaceae bacterium]|nr:hypothetical protein [Oscillospiraceae bacterium]